MEGGGDEGKPTSMLEYENWLARIVGTGIEVTLRKFEEIQFDKMDVSTSIKGQVISNTCGVSAGIIGAAVGLPPAGAYTASKSVSEKIVRMHDKSNEQEKRENILRWTNSLSKNETSFWRTIAKGLAYICISHKGHLENIQENDYTSEGIFSDISRRVFNYLGENPPVNGAILNSKVFYNAFINGRSTPCGLFEQVKALTFKTQRGINIDGNENTHNIFENKNLVIPQEDGSYRLMIKKANTSGTDNMQLKDCRMAYLFENNNNSSQYKYIDRPICPKLHALIKEDWRLCKANIKLCINSALTKVERPDCVIIREMAKDVNFIKDNIKCQIPSEKRHWIHNMDSKWWPEEKQLPKSFMERKIGNDKLYTEQLKNLLTSKTQSIPSIAVISGLGGIGKSTTAKWFAKQFQNDYKFIIWIDCGEKSLINSFEALAKDVDVVNRELETVDLSKECFKVLKVHKCLFIFDNAECYEGENGIANVLPKDGEHDVIITSRSREWGCETAYGKIPAFNVTVFEKDESIQFMKKNINNTLVGDTQSLQHLGELLGHLPLALQLAVAAINKQNERDPNITKYVERNPSIDNYIEKIKNHTGILNNTFGDYSVTINAAMKLSVKQMQKGDRKKGIDAIRLLNIFSYITPNDVCPEFFAAVLEQDRFVVEDAYELLENYSLLTIQYIENSKRLNMHRLLQQVIRENYKNKKNKTIQKILRCEGFLEYKLLPITNYADANLQSEFSHIKKEIIDKLQLIHLLKGGRVQEALELSRLVKDLTKTPVTLYNYAVCLKLNSEIQEAKQVLETLLHNPVSISSLNQPFHNSFGIIADLQIDLSSQVVAGQLFHIYSQLANEKKVTELIRRSTGLILLIKSESLSSIISALGRYSLRELNKYVLTCRGTKEYVALTLDATVAKQMRNIEIFDCDVQIELPKVDYLYLQNVKSLTINIGILNKLKVKGMTINHDSFVNLSTNEVHFENVQVWNWHNYKWTVNKFTLDYVTFVEATTAPNMMVTTMRISNSEFDVSILPSSLNFLYLGKCIISNCFIEDNSQLPLKLQQLELDSNKIKPKPKPIMAINSWTDLGVLMASKIGLTINTSTFDFSHLLKPSLRSFNLNNSLFTNNSFLSTELSFSLQSLQHMDCIDLTRSQLTGVKLPSDIKLFPESLCLWNVTILDDKKNIISNILANDFIDFRRIKKLKLGAVSLSLDFIEPLHFEEVILSGIKIVDWNKSAWATESLALYDTDFVEINQIDAKAINIGGKTYGSTQQVVLPTWSSSVDIEVLPTNVQQLELIYCKLINLPPPGSGKMKQFPLLTKLTLQTVIIPGLEENKHYNISDLIQPTIRDLQITCPENIFTFLISLKRLISVQSIFLSGCLLTVNPVICISPIQLNLDNITFVNENEENIPSILANTFINFSRMEKLKLNSCKGLSVDVSEPITISSVYLGHVEILNSEAMNWKVEKFHQWRNTKIGNT